MTTKTLIIGAGPIGLVLAALLKHNFRSMEVTMYEKRSHYTRQQIVIFRPNVLRLLPREIQKFLKTRGCFINHPNVNKGNCYTKKTPGELISLPLHLFEEDVEEYCKSLGVKRTIQDISALSPFSQKKLRETGTIEGTKYDYIFGCDGSQSWTALNILRAEQTPPLNQPVPFYYGMGLILDVSNRQNKLKPKAMLPLDKSPVQNLYRGFSAKNDSKFYIGISISKKIFNEVKHNNQTCVKAGCRGKKVRNPRTCRCINRGGGRVYEKVCRNTLTYNDMPGSIQKSIRSAIKYYNFKVNVDHTKIYVFEMPLRYFSSPAKVLKNKSTFAALVGDSVFTPHFFSWAGVNSGILEADKIIRLLGSTGPSNISLEKKNQMATSYNHFCKKERRSRWSGYSGLALPFDAIKDSLGNILKSKLVQQGRDRGFGSSIAQMAKTDLGYLMGCDKIPGCKTPRGGPGVESFLTCFKAGCPEYKVRNPRTRRCIDVGGRDYEAECTSPKSPGRHATHYPTAKSN